jgi:hypothetical protein
MRIALVLAFLAGAFLMAPVPASALPALGDHASVSQKLEGGGVETVSRRAQARHAYKRYAYAGRRYNWTYYPYWRPYQYRYWQNYYPYGGPLF